MRIRFARLLAGSVLAAAVASAWSAPTRADEPVRFEIKRFNVSGNTLLPQAEVDAAVAPFVGSGRDFGDVERALEALEAAYHAHGYNVVTVELPEQELQGGEIRLSVVQTKIGRVRVSGNTVFDEANIRRSLPALQEGRTPNIARVSSQLKLANENPAKKVTLKLQGGARDDEVDANLAVADERPWKAMLNVDNTGTAATGKTHVTAMLQHANLFGRDHVGSLQYTTTGEEPDKVAVYGAGYHIPLYALGDSVDLFANYSNIDSGTITAGIFDLAVSGRGAVYGARYNQVLAKRGRFEPRLVYGFDYKAFKNSVMLAGSDFGNDVTVHPLSLTYVASMPTASGEANFSAGLIQNVPGGRHGDSADFDKARAGARAAYTIVRLGASFTHATASGWLARVLVNAQATRDALVPGEQFGAGGAASVRGFGERELSSDSGIAANYELYTPSLCSSPDWQCRALGFFDGAYGGRNAALPGEPVGTRIASAGLGLRIGMGDKLNLQIDWGHVIRRDDLPGTTKNRLHFRAGIAY